ncbi:MULTISPECIES: sulfur carrier protein ThiS [Clostridium]|uniref:Sulfur carrier protein ThiS n=1 Tax=Clostridium senegalense TaxID=1465809 RepID=A0A6M0H586_9CLOT|nr:MULTISPECIES: sulfur carrier protein ThiS [Clostridium]NEU05478.1 sulfur carrier protein ThiS [Clostridium senegalense]
MIVNGKKKNYEGFSVSEMIKDLDLDADKIVVELNLEILPKDEYDKTILKEDDKIEIVAFVGGG